MPYRVTVPAIVTLHDLIPMRYPAYFTAVQRLVFAMAVRLAMRTATTIADSQATANDLIALWPRPKSDPIIITPAADETFCPQPPERVAALRAKFNLPEQYILYFGSNKPHKNLTRLVDAWGRLPKQSIPLIIAGFWDERFPEARQLAEQRSGDDSIRFLGPVVEADVPALYSGAYFFIFPSEYEGFGLPVLEAMACGTAVACSNRSSLPEIGEEAAAYFDPNDVHSIAATIHRLLADPDLLAHHRRQSPCQAARFTWHAAAEQTLTLYRRLSGGDR
jgi:alpha-1,3-rhamnosyl/mannosyltransferase